MPFQKGQTGNARGRPKQTPEQKSQNELFRKLLRQATVPALESIIAIAVDRSSKDCISACRYLIDKAYGANMIFDKNDEPITINVVRHIPCTEVLKCSSNDDWE